MAGTVTVRGLRELQSDFRKMGREEARKLRTALRIIAEPVRRDAEALAGSQIRNIGPRWSRMKIGSTTKMVYVVPTSRRKAGHGNLARPNLGPLLIDRALQPALDRNEGEIHAGLERFMDGIVEEGGWF